MGLYDALTKADLIEGMAKAPDQKKGVPNHAKTLNKMLIEGTTWEQIECLGVGPRQVIDIAIKTVQKRL